MTKTARLLMLLAASLLGVGAGPAFAQKTVDLDAATIADLNAALQTGTLSAEKLVQLCLLRIQAYDRQGPNLRAVIAVNPKALETARALDVERKSTGARSPRKSAAGTKRPRRSWGCSR